MTRKCRDTRIAAGNEPRNNEQIGRYSPVLSVYRLDFCARIRLADGSSQLVLIEIQKAKLPDDIMRFRRYLGEQYANKTNVVREAQGDRLLSSPMPIISIYFLGHELAEIDAPVVHVRRDYYDAITGELLKKRASFIECLSHDSFVIQIPRLHEEALTPLEELLSLFDQHRVDPQNEHELILVESQVPKQFRAVARSLERAGESSEVRQEMTLEDEFIESVLNIERAALARADKAEAEKKQAQAEKEQAQAEKEQAQAEKEQAQAQVHEALRRMLAAGMPESEARRFLNL